jgi:hypothetical protein
MYFMIRSNTSIGMRSSDTAEVVLVVTGSGAPLPPLIVLLEPTLVSVGTGDFASAMSVGLRYASFELSCRRKTVIITSNKNAAASAYGNHVAVAVMADIFSHSGARRGRKSDTRHGHEPRHFFSKRARKKGKFEPC